MNSKNWYLDQAIICEGIASAEWATPEDREKYTRLSEERLKQALYLEEYPDREFCLYCGCAEDSRLLYRGLCEHCANATF